jgi:hypothetical protein
MASLPTTHLWDRWFKRLYTGINFVSAVAFISIIFSIYELICLNIPKSYSGWEALAAFIVIIVSFRYTPLITRRLFSFYWVASYLYAKLTLGIKLNKEEAQSVNFIFIGSETVGGKWYPLTNLKEVDVDIRKEMLFHMVNLIAIEHGHQRIFGDIYFKRLFFARSDFAQNESSKQSKPHSSIDFMLNKSLSILGFKDIPNDFESIKSSYRSKIKDFHPDKFSQEGEEIKLKIEEIAKEINGAYEFLKNYYGVKPNL